MKRFITLALAAALALACLALPALADASSAAVWAKAETDKLPAEARVVNVYTWTYYIPDEVVDMFEEATGMRVNYTPFSEVEEMLAKLLTAGGQYDLIVTSDYSVPILTDADMLEPIDREKLPNFGNINPVYQNQYFDPEDEYQIPYTSYIPLIIYDPAAVDFEVTSLVDLWREEFSGKLAIVEDLRGVIGMAQQKLGMSLNETDPALMEQVKDELLLLKPNIAVLNADTPHNALIGGDAIAGFMFGSQVMAALDDIPELVAVYPSEGLSFGIDCIVIPKGAPHLDATYIFINFLLDGEVSAIASELIEYANCNIAADDFMSDEFKGNIVVNPPAEALARAEMMYPLDADAQRLYDEIWTEFRK